LLHFLVLAGLLFAAHAAIDPGEEKSASPASLRLTATDADWLREMWARQWRRLPTDEEMTRLVADHLKEEVLAREANALQLDVGDTIVRRRLAQKMAFLLEDTLRTAEPPETELRTLYETRPDIVRTSAQVSFEQVFFRREQGDGRARASLAALSDNSASPEEQGDRLLLGDRFSDQREQALTNLFGSAFARSIIDLPVGHWSGPIESSYGLHLVRITSVSPPQARAFSDVRERLVEEWRRERQGAAQAQLLRDLVRKYRVTVDPAVRPFLGPFAEQVEVRP
jgi:hypothetical protein